jgi:hypothetical protein
MRCSDQHAGRLADAGNRIFLQYRAARDGTSLLIAQPSVILNKLLKPAAPPPGPSRG